MAFDYSKLKGKIVEVYETRAAFADAMNWSERTLSLHMNGKTPWKQQDIAKAVDLLSIDPEDLTEYFFKEKVQSS